MHKEKMSFPVYSAHAAHKGVFYAGSGSSVNSAVDSVKMSLRVDITDLKGIEIAVFKRSGSSFIAVKIFTI